MDQQPNLGFIDDTIYLLKEGFELGSLPAGWSVIDSDGDGYNWDASYPSNNFMAHTGAGVIASASFINGVGPLIPDNWLITPAVNVSGNNTLSFWVAGQDTSYVAEHFSVYLSSTGTAVSDFTTILLNDQVTTQTMTQYTIDLSPYAGQTVYIAFRHHNCTNMYWLNLDDVEIFSIHDHSGPWSQPVENGVPGDGGE